MNPLHPWYLQLMSVSDYFLLSIDQKIYISSLTLLCHSYCGRSMPSLEDLWCCMEAVPLGPEALRTWYSIVSL